MRVGFDARSLASPILRGWDRYLVGLARELAKQGVKVTLFHRAGQPLHEAHLTDVECEVVGLKDRSGLHWEQIVLPRALARGKFDLFHAPTEYGVPLAAPCPVVLTIHSLTYQSYAHFIKQGLLTGKVGDYLGGATLHNKWNWRLLFWRACIARVDHVLTPSEFCRQEVLQFLKLAPERVTCTPLAVHQQFLQPAKSETGRAAILDRLGVKKPYLLFVGGFEPHKNIKGLLQTFALVRAARPELQLAVVGSKELPNEIHQYAEELGLRPGKEVTFHLNLTNELTDLYDDAELMVTLSWRESFCLPALEAMSRGTPVVASAWGATPEVVADGGALVDPRDHLAARDAILTLLADGNRLVHSTKARELAMKFTWASTAERTRKVYHELVSH